MATQIPVEYVWHTITEAQALELVKKYAGSETAYSAYVGTNPWSAPEAQEAWKSLCKQSGVSIVVNGNGKIVGYEAQIGVPSTLAGGEQRALEVVDVVGDTTNRTFTTYTGGTNSGSATPNTKGFYQSGVKALNVLTTVANGIGLGMLAYNANPEYWQQYIYTLETKVLTDPRSIVQGFSGDPAKAIPTLLPIGIQALKNAETQREYYKTYFREQDVQTCVDVLNELNAFDYHKTKEEYAPSSGSMVRLQPYAHSSDYVVSAYNHWRNTSQVQPTWVVPSSTLRQAYDISLREAVDYFGENPNMMKGTIFYNSANDYIDVQTYFAMYDGEEVEVYDSSLISPQEVPTKTVTPETGSHSSLYTWIYTSCRIASAGLIYQTQTIVTTLSGTFHTPTNVCYGNNYQTVEFSNGFSEIIDRPASPIVSDIIGTIPEEGVPLSVTYPDLYENAYETTSFNPETGENEITRWLPFSIPDIDPTTQANPLTQPQAQTGNITPTQPQPFTDLADLISRLIGNDTLTPTVPSTPSGDTPDPPTPVIITTGSANGLISIYNPTKAQIDSFAGWLWSTDFVDTLLKLFQSPMDAIIGLHLLYATPITDGTGAIKVGYLTSPVTGVKLVSNQYTSIDCGSIRIPEKYGSVEDYDPYTKISIYLPFIGIQELDTNLVMASELNVTYMIDVLTGACLCTITVTKDGVSNAIYHYSGNCAVQLPLSSGTNQSIISALIGSAGMLALGSGLGAVGAGLMGGALKSLKAGVQKSGSLTANIGAMDIKIPYVIITRYTPYPANVYNQYYGLPSNTTVVLQSCIGYTRVKDVHADVITDATQEEKDLIESTLKNGVIITNIPIN